MNVLRNKHTSVFVLIVLAKKCELKLLFHVHTNNLSIRTKNNLTLKHCTRLHKNSKELDGFQKLEPMHYHSLLRESER